MNGKTNGIGSSELNTDNWVTLSLELNSSSAFQITLDGFWDQTNTLMVYELISAEEIVSKSGYYPIYVSGYFHSAYTDQYPKSCLAMYNGDISEGSYLVTTLKPNTNIFSARIQWSTMTISGKYIFRYKYINRVNPFSN